MAGLGPNKQFTCDIPDCRQCFLSEDHPSPYPVRHDRETKSLLSFDQTPTPTTIFRKCEEAGLLRALQVENPFDETFRKATEGIRSGRHPLDQLHLHPNAPESLNTPKVIFPGSAERRVANEELQQQQLLQQQQQQLSRLADPDPIQPSSIVRREADTSDAKTEENDDICSNEIVVAGNKISATLSKASTENVSVTLKATDDSDASRSVQVILKLPDGKLVQLSTLPVEPVPATGGAVPPNIPIIKVDAPTDSPETETTAALQPKVSLAKQKLKQALMSNTCPAATGPSAGNTNNKVVRTSLIPQQPCLQQVPLSVAPARLDSGQKSAANSDDDAEARRRKFLERNRAAAMRCREKRKTWVQELERNSNEMMRTNQMLEKEIAHLRTEVAHLKTLLLAHKDCPITKAMARGEAALPGLIGALPASSALPRAAAQPQLVNLAPTSTSTGQTVVIQPPAQPVLLLNDPRSKRRRHTSGGEMSFTCGNDMSEVVSTASGSIVTTTVSPVIISSFVTTTPALIGSLTKQAFILPKTDNLINASVPSVVAPAFTGTLQAWDRRDGQHDKLQNRTSSILSTNVIKVNPNVVDRDIEIIDIKEKAGL